jgi:pimeloyl-ACP methyl ester carboxylesterase
MWHGVAVAGRIALWVVAVLVLLMIVGMVWEALAQRKALHANPAPGRMVEVDGRRIHVLCKGEGAGPTIVLVMGAAESSPYWWPVQDNLSQVARVCTYDRPGTGWSDPAKTPQSIEDRAAELDRVLAAAQVPGPYVLVGHSYGGPLIRLFARDHPLSVAGMVLVDTPDEECLFRPSYLEFLRGKMRPIIRVMGFAQRIGALRLWGGLVPDNIPEHARQAILATSSPANYVAALDEFDSIARAPARLHEAGGLGGSLGHRPLVVITHGLRFPPPYDVLEIGWDEGQKSLAALSDNSELLVAHKSNHMIQLDEPELVTEAIRRVWTVARDGARLEKQGSFSPDK